MLLFGGVGSAGNALNELWQLDLGTTPLNVRMTSRLTLNTLSLSIIGTTTWSKVDYAMGPSYYVPSPYINLPYVEPRYWATSTLCPLN